MCVDQDVHLHAGRLRAARAAPRPHPRPLAGRRHAAHRRRSQRLPEQMREILASDEQHPAVAREATRARANAFFIGRAQRLSRSRCEGAQKLKEISYIHAEAYPASELKHGPLALISPGDADRRRPAARRSLREDAVVARGDPRPARPGDRGHARRRRAACPAKVDDVLRGAADRAGAEPDPADASRCSCSPTTAAVALGRDIDQPRNLAKSVTVE